MRCKSLHQRSYCSQSTRFAPCFVGKLANLFHFPLCKTAIKCTLSSLAASLQVLNATLKCTHFDLFPNRLENNGFHSFYARSRHSHTSRRKAAAELAALDAFEKRCGILPSLLCVLNVRNSCDNAFMPHMTFLLFKLQST